MLRVKTSAKPTTVDGAASAAPAAAKAPTKAAMVLALLEREHGATLAELVEATSWQPHTTRAMLTGLRKKGHAIERGRRGDLTCYLIPAAPSPAPASDVEEG